jgi:hypothetical protein
MAKPARPFKASKTVAKNVSTKASGISNTPKQPRSHKGKLIVLPQLYSRKFQQRLQAASPNRDVKDLRGVLIKAFKSLKQKNIKSITSTAWLGEAFQVIVERHPVIIDLMEWTAGWYVRAINSRLGSLKVGIQILNGHLARVDVKSKFSNILMIHNVRLRRPGEDTGKEFFDTGMLASNTNNQHLPMNMEIKTRGAGKELPHQLGDFYDRLKASPPGTELIYSIVGQQGEKTIDIKDMILIVDKQKRPLEEDFFSRIGVIAGNTPIIRKGRDARGRLYIRVKLPIDTDTIRRVLERMLRDRSWQ